MRWIGMMKLLHAGIIRYIKNPLTAIISVAAFIIGLLGGSNAVYSIDDVFLIALFIAFSAFISLFIGREHGDGGFRNKIITGFTKGQIFFSEWLSHTLLCLGFLILFFIGFALTAHELLSHVPMGMLALIAFCFICMTVAIVTLICVISALISSRAISAVLSVMLVIGLMGASYSINDALSRPQYYMLGYYDDNNELIMEQKEDPRYVDGAARSFLTHLNYTLPLGQSEPLIEAIAIWNYSNSWVDHDFTWLKTVKFLPLYSLSVTAFIGGIGFAIFRRRDLK